MSNPVQGRSLPAGQVAHVQPARVTPLAARGLNPDGRSDLRSGGSCLVILVELAAAIEPVLSVHVGEEQ